jgi:ABC-type transporter Mla MlaB component
MAALTYTPVFAHLGHWYVSLPVFGGPVVIIAIFVKLSERRERRRVRDGDTTHLRVVATTGDDRTTLSVNGALDYPALLDIESEIDAAVRRAPQVLLDLSSVTSVEVDVAWGVSEVINAVRGADVAVLIGPATALRPLREVCTLEGVKLVDDVAVISGPRPKEFLTP